MNRIKISFKFCLSLLIFTSALTFSACSHKDELLNDPEESKSKEDESHNAGEDCMRCHHDNKNEASEKWWYVAGTVYDDKKKDPVSEGTVELWTEPAGTGTFIYRLAIDKKGNFYTNKIINFKGGYYPIVIHNNDTFVMPDKVTGSDLNRSCNSCHDGKTTDVINLN